MKKVLKVANTPQRGLHLLVFGIPVPLLSIPTKASRAYAHRFNGFSTEEEKIILENMFFSCFGRLPNLAHPITFNEKLTWLKIYYRNPLMTICADKVKGREYFLQKIDAGERFLVNQIGVYKSGEEIDFSELPNSFILKANWGSGCQLFVRNKGSLCERKVRRLVSKWMELSSNHYYASLEWGYKDIPPRIVCEEILDFEYKIEFFCFNGEPRFFWIVINDKTVNVRANFYNLDWSFIPVNQKYLNFDNQISRPSDSDYQMMLDISKKLSEGFPFVRCDFFKTKDGFKFSELTFYHWGATCKFEPDRYDKIFGDMLFLPSLDSNNQI